MDTYNAKATCLNCKDTWTEKVPMGIAMDDYEKRLTCKRCGCNETSLAPPKVYGA